MSNTCEECKYRMYLVALGQGVFCINERNKDKILCECLGLKHNGWPFLLEGFVCDYFIKKETPYESLY